jgi:SAM-dependent methyltransferase
MWLFFERRTDLFTKPNRMLHIAPEWFFAERLMALGNIDYLSADIQPSSAMVQMDITDIGMMNDSFDVICASHVLEHVPDDTLAMRELCRVLKPGGWAILQVPIWRDTTKEDPTVTDPDERTRLFGQSDHVRMYGRDGVYERRLRASGFDVSVVPFVRELSDEQVRLHRLLKVEDIYVCRKPEVAGVNAALRKVRRLVDRHGRPHVAAHARLFAMRLARPPWKVIYLPFSTARSARARAKKFRQPPPP